MKKICISVLFFLFSSLTAHAAPPVSEEEDCFSLLNTKIQNDGRFEDLTVLKNGNLSRVVTEGGGEEIDISSYSGFLENRAYKSSTRPTDTGSTDYLFYARRNHIGTIIAPPGNDYTITQLVGFGRASNFDFPLNGNGQNFGDSYRLNGEYFREYIVYTHHLNVAGEKPLLSCGIVKIIPLGGNGFTNIEEERYKTNILDGIHDQSVLGNKKCSSGFEPIGRMNRGGHSFFGMKANVCVIDYNDDDLLKMEVISIAYDNGSPVMNEYITHPFQIQAMNDAKDNSGGLKAVQDRFKALLKDNTCLSVVHGTNRARLPAGCGGHFGGLIAENSSILKKLYSFFQLPKAVASLTVSDDSRALPKEYGEMMGYNDLPYSLYKKLESIPDKDFVNSMLIALTPNFDAIIANRKNSNTLLTPYEEVFASCGMNYSQRLSIASDFLSKLDVANFDLANLEYSDPKFGDCIIPYPDKTHRNTVIEGSFPSNQILAQQVSGNYTPSEILQSEYDIKMKALEQKYNQDVLDLERKYNAGEMTLDEFNSQKEKFKEDYTLQIQELEKSAQKVSDVISKSENGEIPQSMKYKTFLYILGLLAAGFSLMLGALFVKKRFLKLKTEKHE